MDQQVQDATVTGAVVDILAAAVDEYCAAFAEIAEEVDHGRSASPRQLERAMVATLRLENAQTLVALDACDRHDGDQATQQRRVH